MTIFFSNYNNNNKNVSDISITVSIHSFIIGSYLMLIAISNIVF